MSITIYTNGHINVDGKDTGLGVSQGRHGTEVFTREAPRRQEVINGKLEWLPACQYQKHQMPHGRYVLSHDDGNGRNPGLKQFEADVLALLETLGIR